ncbi:hypothetical protein AXK56_19265 [Tsukamurella pulmonis]|nr:hypothetical protein AXK56_19265 [Tsukamurella pulmonis]
MREVLVAEAVVLGDLGGTEIGDGEVDDGAAAFDLRHHERGVAAEEFVDDPAVLAEPHRVAHLGDDVFGAADDLPGDERVELALGLVAGAAHGRSLGRHGPGGHTVEGVDERTGIVDQLRRRRPLHPHAHGVAVGGEQVGLDDQRRSGVERSGFGDLAHEELALELEVPETLLRHVPTVTGRDGDPREAGPLRPACSRPP